MDYDIVLATRNRYSVLQLSIPLMLCQSLPPKNLIVVDSSDDHNKVLDIIRKIINSTNRNIKYKIIYSDPGLTLQRNIGLKHVTSEIIMFPDDDSLWFPKMASSVMEIYEKDQNQVIGAVAASELFFPPNKVIKEKEKACYKMSIKDRLQFLRLSPTLTSLEDKLFPNPFMIEGQYKQKDKQLPANLKNIAKLFPTLLGFRMSFRRKVIQNFQFDEILGRYALYEDRDAALYVLNSFLIAESLKAKVFHYRSPEQRTSGKKWGIMSILNMAYIICKHTSSSSSRRLVKHYCRYITIRYLMQTYTKYGRERAIGALKAYLRLSEILNSSKTELSHTYKRIFNKCLG